VVVQVSFEVMFLGEGLGAQLAGIWLDSGMQSHVKRHVAPVGERFTTNAARERFLTSVDSQMLFEQHFA
jgi:hypothetical protein